MFIDLRNECAGSRLEMAGCAKRARDAWRRIPRPPPIRLFLAGVVAATLFGGCGGSQGPERVVVTGAVTYNGKPIPDGTILFMPTTSLPATAAVIVNGHYKADGLGGVPVGTHKLQFEAFRTDPLPGQSQAQPRFGGTIRRQYLPKKFNADSQLEITIRPGSREITKNIDLSD